MASYVPAKRGVPYITWTSLVNQSSRPAFKTTPTLAAGDVKISKDGGSLTNLTNLPTVTPGSSPLVKISLTGSEMDAEIVTVIFQDAAGAEWDDQLLVIPTVSRNIDELSPVIRTGIVGDAIGPNFIWLDSGASATNNIYNGNVITICSGSGAGQTRILTSYTGISKLCQVKPDWIIVPDRTSTFCLLPTGPSNIETWRLAVPENLMRGKVSSIESIFSGTLSAGGDSIVQLDASADTSNINFYQAEQLWVISGAAMGQQRYVVNYDQTARELTLTHDLIPNAATNDFVVLTRGGGISLETWRRATPNDIIQGKLNVLPPNLNSNSFITVTSGNLNCIILGAEAVGTDDYYTGEIITPIAGTNQGQSRVIVSYLGASKIANISPPWAQVPINGDLVAISPGMVKAQFISSGVADQIFDRASTAEGYTFRQLARLWSAALLGKANGLAGTTVHYRDIADTKDRITATVDADGNRSAVTLDGS